MKISLHVVCSSSTLSFAAKQSAAIHTVELTVQLSSLSRTVTYLLTIYNPTNGNFYKAPLNLPIAVT